MAVSVNTVRSSEKKNTKRLRNMLFESQTSLTFQPLHVFFISLGFMFVVLFLHILLKVFPKTSPLQILIAILVLIFSLITSHLLIKK